MVGMHVSADRGPWRAGAPASISIAYRNQGDHGTYRLNAHVAGDPDDKVYCIDGYQSGQVALPGMLRTECWGDGGKPLDSFRDVDHVNLLLLSSEAATSFDYCVTGVAVNGTAARAGDAGNGHVVVGDNGKLGGDMTGYAWVAGGAGTAWSTPATCDRNGCFRNTQGRLCAKGTIAALSCTGRGTSQLSCDWATNWGAMIGLNANVAAGAWGAGAPSTVTLAFTGPPVVYRLTAHVAGDPDSESYCLDGYQSGQTIDAHALRTRCWNDSGEVLRDFQKVDRIGLELLAGEAPIAFDMCISDIVTR